MAERKYSVSEIDQMRRCLIQIICNDDYRMGDVNERAEDILRTHMMNGTEPSELEDARRASDEERLARDEVEWQCEQEEAAERAALRAAQPQPVDAGSLSLCGRVRAFLDSI